MDASMEDTDWGLVCRGRVDAACSVAEPGPPGPPEPPTTPRGRINRFPYPNPPGPTAVAPTAVPSDGAGDIG
jgi:hypothetical protein